MAGSDRQRTAAAGLKSVVLALSTSGVICRNALTSSTQMLRPCVAATISLAVIGWANFFVVTCLTATPGLVLLVIFRRRLNDLAAREAAKR